MKRALATVTAALLWLFAFIFVMGALKLYRHPEPDGSAADWILPSMLGVSCTGVAAFLTWRLRPRPATAADLLLWPSVQALVLYAGAMPLMGVLSGFAQLIAFGAYCAFCLGAPAAALFRPRWGTTALSALLWGLLLFGALTATADAFGERLGEGAMVYLLPLSALPALLVAAGAVRIVWKRPGAAPSA